MGTSGFDVLFHLMKIHGPDDAYNVQCVNFETNV